MGMYDYLGDSQIKAFYVSGNPIHADENGIVYQPYAMGGNLRHYTYGDKVPYYSFFYNYGKNFIIFDERPFTMDENTDNIHIIENGIYTKSYNHKNVPNNLKLELVVSYTGIPLNITKSSDFETMINESIEKEEKYQELIEKYETEAGIFKIKNIEELKKHTADEIKENFKKADEIRNKVGSETIFAHHKKWFKDEKSEEYIQINKGFKLGYLLDIIINRDFHEYEKYLMMNIFMEETNIYDLIDEYLDWTEEDITKEKILEIINKYKESPSEEITKDFIEKSENN